MASSAYEERTEEVHTMLGLRGRAFWTALAALGALLSSACWAADPAIGTVDMAKVYTEAPRIKQLRERLEQRSKEFESRLDIREQNLMLTEEQVRELIDLKMKPSPTDKDKARIQELTDIERSLDEQLKNLQNTPQDKLTDTEKTRLKELTDLQTASKTAGGQIEKDYNSQLQNEARELEAKASEEISAVIKQIAESKKLAYVVDKAVVFFGGTEITNEVIAKLDRRAE